MNETTVETTLGTILWNGLTVEINNGQLALEIPAYFCELHVPLLEKKARELFEGKFYNTAFYPGSRWEDDRGAGYDEGTIYFASMPDLRSSESVTQFKQQLEELFQEAGKEEVELLQRAAQLQTLIRTTPTAET